MREGGTRTEALAVYSMQHKIPVRTLKRWIAKYRDNGIIGLVDTRGSGEGIDRPISEEAFDFFKSMYLDQRRLSVKARAGRISVTKIAGKKRAGLFRSLRTMYDVVNKQNSAARAGFASGRACRLRSQMRSIYPDGPGQHRAGTNLGGRPSPVQLLDTAQRAMDKALADGLGRYAVQGDRRLAYIAVTESDDDFVCDEKGH